MEGVPPQANSNVPLPARPCLRQRCPCLNCTIFATISSRARHRWDGTVGISSPGPKTCAGYMGSYGHEDQDAKTFSAWGIDYLKYDWCSAGRIYKPEDMHAVYQIMGYALQKTGRKIVYSLCQYGKA